MSEYNPYEFDKIPEFAMQPARENIDDTFDPSIYEQLLAGLEETETAEAKGQSAVSGDVAMPEPALEDAFRKAEGPAREANAPATDMPKAMPEIEENADGKVNTPVAAPAMDTSEETVSTPKEDMSTAEVIEAKADGTNTAASGSKEGASTARKAKDSTDVAMPEPALEDAFRKAEGPAREANAPATDMPKAVPEIEENAAGKVNTPVAEPAMDTSEENAPTMDTPEETVSTPKEGISAPKENTSAAESEPEPEEPEAVPADASGTEGTVISAGESVITDSLRLVDMTTCEPVRIYVEEDILVPDVKPDLASVLAMDGTLLFSEREGKISGDLMLQTLYIPQGKGADRSVVAIESRIPFQQGSAFSTAQADEGDVVDVKASAVIESLDYSVINERKFRVKATIIAEGREYHSRKLELFQGLKTDDVQMLKETLTVTDVILRKSERLELEEDLILPDGLPEVGSVLRCDVTLVENHKQISREKVVISGTAYCNIMYLPMEDASGAAGTGASDASGTAGVAGGRSNSGAAGGGISGGERFSAQNPVLFQGKSEFTQFIALGGAGQVEQPTGGRVFFRKKSAAAEPKESESGLRNVLHLNLDGETFVELYRDVEQAIVTDAYHHQKEMVFDRSEISLMQLCPGGLAETTVREVVNIPDMYDGVDRVAFLSGGLTRVTSKVEGNKNVVEGLVAAKLVCLTDDENAVPFSLRRELPFRIAMDLPGGMEDAAADNETLLKELRFDRLNNRQIELNASVMVNSAVIGRKQCPLIRNVGFLESSGPEQETPGLVLYITRSGDTLWKIARRYRTTIDTVARINGIDQTSALKPGTKLLIVK